MCEFNVKSVIVREVKEMTGNVKYVLYMFNKMYKN